MLFHQQINGIKMRTIIILLILSASSFACKAQNTTTIKKQDATHVVLIGKTFKYDYGDYIFHTTFVNDSTLHWKKIKAHLLI